MKITSVKVRLVESQNSHMKGTAVVVLDDCFKIKGIRIIEKEGTLFAAMPSRKGTDGEFYDICHPTDEATRKMFNDAIVEEYNKVLNNPELAQ